MPITSSPRSSSFRLSADPITPAEPVTRIFMLLFLPCDKTRFPGFLPGNSRPCPGTVADEQYQLFPINIYNWFAYTQRQFPHAVSGICRVLRCGCHVYDPRIARDEHLGLAFWSI